MQPRAGVGGPRAGCGPATVGSGLAPLRDGVGGVGHDPAAPDLPGLPVRIAAVVLCWAAEGIFGNKSQTPIDKILCFIGIFDDFQTMQNQFVGAI